MALSSRIATVHYYVYYTVQHGQSVPPPPPLFPIARASQRLLRCRTEATHTHISPYNTESYLTHSGPAPFMCWPGETARAYGTLPPSLRGRKGKSKTVQQYSADLEGEEKQDGGRRSDLTTHITIICCAKKNFSLPSLSPIRLGGEREKLILPACLQPSLSSWAT